MPAVAGDLWGGAGVDLEWLSVDGVLDLVVGGGIVRARDRERDRTRVVVVDGAPTGTSSIVSSPISVGVDVKKFWTLLLEIPTSPSESTAWTKNSTGLPVTGRNPPTHVVPGVVLRKRSSDRQSGLVPSR